jgi:hypothetical protein
MINTDFAPENQEEYDGTFVVSGNDDTAFFNMNLCGTQSGIDSFLKSNEKKNDFNFGGLKYNTFSKKNETVVTTGKTFDPSASCSKNCESCVWSQFCGKMTKSLITLGSTAGSIPRLG